MEKHFKVGVMGVGMVGAPLVRYLAELKGYKRGGDLFLFDKDPKKKMNDDVNKADIIFVAVPTPPNADRSCNTSIVEAAVATVAPGKVVVIKSTVEPGTTEMLQRRHPKLKMLFNPEFLTEARAWEDMLRPDRQIVGFTETSMEAAHHVLALLPKAPFMSPWGLGTYKQIRLSATEAEFVKYAANVYFAMKVNWANALFDVANKLGATYDNVRMGMAADHRIGDSHLDAGHGGYRGFGGYCLPKDLDAFLVFAKKQKLTNVVNLLTVARDFNEELLKSQGLTVADVSEHDASLRAKLAKRKAR